MIIDQITNIIADQEFADDTATKLRALIADFRTGRDGCQPGVALRKIIDALDEAARSSLRIPS